MHGGALCRGCGPHRRQRAPLGMGLLAGHVSCWGISNVPGLFVDAANCNGSLWPESPHICSICGPGYLKIAILFPGAPWLPICGNRRNSASGVLPITFPSGSSGLSHIDSAYLFLHATCSIPSDSRPSAGTILLRDTLHEVCQSLGIQVF